MKVRTGIVLVAMALIGALSGDVLAQDLPVTQQQALAKRFLPLILTTTSGGAVEPFAPANWDWFASRSTLVKGYVSHTCAAGHGTNDEWPDGTVVIDFHNNPAADVNRDIMAQPCADIHNQLCLANPATANPRYALHMDDASDHTGEAWSDVIHAGHGIYAHVESVPNTGIVNIEYTILWAYNSGFCDHHEADITSVVIDYDSGTDRLNRVSYSVHGYALEEFDVQHWSGLKTAFLQGLDEDGASTGFYALQLTYQQPWVHQKGGDHYNPSSPLIYLVQGPDSVRFEHPVVFAEYGGHELWPNPFNGSVPTVADHNGTGLQFIPDTFQLLGTVANPVPMFAPLVYLNGLFGSDGQSLATHRTWFWPGGRPLPDYRFTDGDPYSTQVGLGWPPVTSAGADPLYVQSSSPSRNGAKGSAAFDGTQAKPIPDLNMAYSLLAGGGTLYLTGNFPRLGKVPSLPYSYRFDRPARLVSLSGPVRIGVQQP